MDLAKLEKDLEGAVARLEKEFHGIQAGGASPALLENVPVQASYGPMKLGQMGNIVVMDSQTLKVETWDKNELKNIEKGIFDANLGLTPRNEGEHLIVPVPPMTQERRQELVKKAKEFCEDAKIRARQARQDAVKKLDALLKEKEISEDEHKKIAKDLEDVVKKAMEKIEAKLSEKSEKILKI